MDIQTAALPLLLLGPHSSRLSLKTLPKMPNCGSFAAPLLECLIHGREQGGVLMEWTPLYSVSSHTRPGHHIMASSFLPWASGVSTVRIRRDDATGCPQSQSSPPIHHVSESSPRKSRPLVDPLGRNGLLHPNLFIQARARTSTPKPRSSKLDHPHRLLAGGPQNSNVRRPRCMLSCILHPRTTNWGWTTRQADREGGAKTRLWRENP